MVEKNLLSLHGPRQVLARCISRPGPEAGSSGPASDLTNPGAGVLCTDPADCEADGQTDFTHLQALDVPWGSPGGMRLPASLGAVPTWALSTSSCPTETELSNAALLNFFLLPN